MPITTLVLDFDGTCTDIPAIEQRFLDDTLEFLARSEWHTSREEWQEALAAVRAASPDLGWTLGGLPAAPAAADPYILSGEAIRHLAERGGVPSLATPAYAYAYQKSAAKLRPELRHVLERALALGVIVRFVSNSKTAALAAHLDALLADAPELRAQLEIHGDAQKFRVTGADWEATHLGSAPAMQGVYRALPEHVELGLARPIYLRRGLYLQALAAVWGGDPARAASTLVCGDIWELDLALPAQLGCQLHLIERAAPYDTYPYERDAARATGASVSPDLLGLLARLEAEVSPPA